MIRTSIILRRFLGPVMVVLFVLGTAVLSLGELEPMRDSPQKGGPARIDLANPNIQNRVHRVGNMWMNITNWGFFGNYSVWGGVRDAMDDPEYPGTWAPQCEYPADSDIQYLFQGALWLGALVQQEGYEFPRVSTGTDGWIRPRINEFYPPEGEPGRIIERSTRPNQFNRLGEYVTDQKNAVSEQDFVVVYSDTLKDDFWLDGDPIDGPHFPLGIKITQKSYAWSYAYAQNFIIIDWEVENIAGNYLKNLYVGLYIDADVGWEGEPNDWYLDDVCGFQRWFYYDRPDGTPDSAVINTAWIADNDGRPVSAASGNDFSAPSVTGVRVVRAPNPKLKTSFNWWISNPDSDLDFGPSWMEDNSPGAWTNIYGTPIGDTRKYFVLSNGEFDYDQVRVNDDEYIIDNPQIDRDRWTHEELDRHEWKIPGVTDETPEALVNDLANGYDTRYLLSWGPLGVFDHFDQAGNRIYRLNPGEKFSMTIAYVAGDAFHNLNNPQPDNQIIRHDLFDFTSLRYNANWAAKVYDNPMIDTPIYDTDGDGILDEGDGWYGEDTGIDGLYSPDPVNFPYAFKWVGGQRIMVDYPGEDEGEMNNHLEPEEDALERPLDFEYTQLNGMLDLGDGYPDFRGPPPPDPPRLEVLSRPITIVFGPDSLVDSIMVIDKQFLSNHIVLKWGKDDSEKSVDPFSREEDFEGYRVYISNTGLEVDFAFQDEYDRVDWAYYSETDSLASRPVENIDSLPSEKTMQGVRLYLREVGRNIGLATNENFIYEETTRSYYYIHYDAHPMVPRYYSVTAFDYGDYKTGTPPLESAKRANMKYIAPTGSDQNKVMVVPNPYRAYVEYTRVHGGGLAWENRDDGTADFYPQMDRRLYFYNLPRKCMIRIYTVAGDLVDIIEHDADDQSGWSEYAESWNLNSRNKMQVVSGLYLFSVENLTPGNTGKSEIGKFVIIR